MKSIIVDTSVATKWIFEEEEKDFDKAQEILQHASFKKLHIFAPDIILLELANVIYLSKKQNKKECMQSLKFYKSTMELITFKDLTLVTDLMYSHKLASYDAVFIALAIKKQIPLVTADYKHHLKSITPRIIWLSEWNGILK